MKNLNYCLTSLLVFTLLACGSSGTKKIELPVVDVTKSYPEKEIVLQDIADVEYIPLETRDDVLIDRAKRIVFVSKDTIIVCNTAKGDVLFFDGEGRFSHGFNHKGQSGQEYLSMIEVVFDATKKEVYVYDILGSKKRILVYSEQGDFKKSLSLDAKNFGAFVDYDNKSFLAFESLEFGRRDADTVNKTPFFFVDKQSGEIDTLKRFSIRNRENTAMYQTKGEFQITFVSPSSYIIPLQSQHAFVLDELTKDTIFQYNGDKLLAPICVKTPSFKDLGEDKVLVLLESVSEKWMFMSLQPQRLNMKEYTIDDIRNNKVQMLEPTDLLVNRKTGDVVTCRLKNKDILSEDFEVEVQNSLLSIDKLMDLSEDGKLSGKIKEITEKLTADDNPVLVKVKFKE